MNKLILAALLTVATATAVADSEWVEVVSSDTTVYSIKKKSVTLSQTDSGTHVIVAVGRSRDIESTRLMVYQMYVPVADCVARSGTFVVTDLAGVVTSKTEFVFDLGSIAAELAQVICEVGKPTRPRAPSKADNLKTT